jgi:hypothetical protein
VRALALGTTAAYASTIWSVLPQPDGSLLIGTGNEGKLLRLQAGKVSVAAESKQLVVTSLAQAWRTVVVGTMPTAS